jgi:hypothetical protein
VENGFREVKLEGVDWTHVTADKERLVGSCESDNEPPDSVKCEKSFDWFRN